jgi:hypothetical protein
MLDTATIVTDLLADPPSVSSVSASHALLCCCPCMRRYYLSWRNSCLNGVGLRDAAVSASHAVALLLPVHAGTI